MATMRIAVVSVILCGLASATPAYADDGRAVAAALAKVIERRDVAAFQRMLDLAVSLNGLRFTTPACQRFTEDYSRLAYAFADDFLTCIAALHPRVIAGRAALSYEPGGEIALDVNNGFIRGFYGYAKRRPDAPPGPPDAPIATVQPAALEALRVAGDKAIAPDAISAADLARVHPTLPGLFKLCMSAAGELTDVDRLKSTGARLYDLQIVATVKSSWQFRPYTVAHRPSPVCASFALGQAPASPAKPIAPTGGAMSANELEALRADVEMICGAARATGGTAFMPAGPYIAEHMKTRLLADLFANLRTTTTLEMIVTRIQGAMARVHVERCESIDVWLEGRRSP